MLKSLTYIGLPELSAPATPEAILMSIKKLKGNS